MVHAACIVAAAMLVFSGAIPQGAGAEDRLYAWWVHIEFEPDQTEIRGIGVQRFSKRWVRAKALNTDDLRGRISQEELEDFVASPFGFRKVLDLNGDGRAEEAFVGVYENNEGHRGRFLAILEDGALVQTFLGIGPAGFSALNVYDGELLWGPCMGCGDYEILVWDGARYLLRE